jgi:hypothetical protein
MATVSTARERVPLRQRRPDLVLVGFFLVNLCFITYFVDIEQLAVADPAHFTYPVWPPHWTVDLVHWYGNHYDPLVMARPPWFRMTIWIDVVYFGPFYLAAIVSFLRGWNGIRVPALVWSGMLLSNVVIILGEEWGGPHATGHFWLVLILNAPWLLLPLGVIWRMRRDHPFTRPVPAAPASADPVPGGQASGRAATEDPASGGGAGRQAAGERAPGGSAAAEAAGPAAGAGVQA